MQHVLACKYLASSVVFAHCIFFFYFKVANNVVEDIEISLEVDIPDSYETNTK